MINRKFGCELAFTEMINCSSISHKSRKTQQMLVSHGRDRPLGIQLLGSEEELIAKAMNVLERYEFDILDFNAACPVKKVVARGQGSAFMKEPKRLHALLKFLVRNSRVPVTVKIRAGWDAKTINAKETALLAQDAGVSGLFIHGRTRLQGYSGNVNYRIIREVKEALEIPVLASGDILSPPLVKKMFDETGCDAVIFARGALGNPWIFKESQELLKNGKLHKKPDRDTIVRVMLEHLNACVDFYGQRIGVVIFRKFFSWYTKGLPHIRALREKSSRVKTLAGMAEIIEGCRPAYRRQA